MLDAAGYSHIGNRENNQDAFLINNRLGLYLVADGVGGHQAGEIASELTCQIINQRIAAGTNLIDAIHQSHNSIVDVANNSDRAGMASTVVALKVERDNCMLAWVGDSRGYFWQGELQILTRDHTRIQALLDIGLISSADARTHPEKGVLTQALGIPDRPISVDRLEFHLAIGQTIMMCTDGIYDVVPEAIINDLLSQQENATITARSLVECAVAQGAQDNCTCLILRKVAEPSDDDRTAVLHL
ncbi:MAG: protein phosphatase 2C domain-containing protein [Candidatus Thiodiazotropha sp. (ex. Lucinisca nassula)]|nr:protein phosphatase 2C domain-containing protein [Candidatus Thiodiazotropha sp. (ex. Lucinisca nassula)]MBW9271264.1 protein phosphatase 2C domain-containing protein [Candidatus Thiodiazotropha sp. (ex. Lucinisca nassula)]